MRSIWAWPDENPNWHEQIAVTSPNFFDWQMMKILIETDGMLDAISIDFLFKIAVPVEQSNRDKIQIKITRGFAMVPRKNSETT